MNEFLEIVCNIFGICLLGIALMLAVIAIIVIIPLILIVAIPACLGVLALLHGAGYGLQDTSQGVG